MVYLLTDVGEYRQLPCPSVVTFGREHDNTIRPTSRSVSKYHAKITIDYIPRTTKINIQIEDLESRNGTYVGETPLDIERIKGIRKLSYGDYIRFGLAENFFRLLETIPSDQMPIEHDESELQISPNRSPEKNLDSVGGFLPPIEGSSLDFQSLLEKSNIPTTMKFGTNMPGGVASMGNSSSSALKLPDINQMSQSNKYPSQVLGMSNGILGSSGLNPPPISAIQSQRLPNELNIEEGVMNRSGKVNNKTVTIISPHSSEAADDSFIDPRSLNPPLQQQIVQSRPQPSFDQLLAFQKYSFPNYTKELMIRYYQLNKLWLQQLYHQLQQTNQNQPFYLTFIENVMQIKSIGELMPRAMLLIANDESKEEQETSKKKRKNDSTLKISSIYHMEGNKEEEMIAISKLFQSLSSEQKDYICSEFMAENLLVSESASAPSSANPPATTITTIAMSGDTISQLYDLYKLCFLGASQPISDSTGPQQQVGEVDFLLTQELIAITKQCIRNVTMINQSSIVQALVEAEPLSYPSENHGMTTEEEDEANTLPVPLTHGLLPSLYHHLDFISQRLETLTHFLSFYFLHPTQTQTQSQSQTQLTNQQVFDIMKNYIAVLLVLLYKVYLVVLEVYAEVGSLYDQHLVSNQNQTSEHSLLHELQRLTMMNFSPEEEAAIEGGGGSLGGSTGGSGKVDVKTIIQKLRKHEEGMAGKKFSGLYRVLQIFYKYALQRYFRHWRGFIKQHKQYEIDIQDKEERLITRQKAEIFSLWRDIYNKRRLKRKCLSRMLRTINRQFEKTKMTCFRRWKDVIFQMNRLHPLISELKLQVLSLQSEIELMQAVGGNNTNPSTALPPPPYPNSAVAQGGGSGVSAGVGPSLLAAERALNKELLNTNMALRESVKELELKLLEMNNISLPKRKDIVYHYLLDKESQLITSKQEIKLLQAELDQLRNILHLQQSQQQGRNLTTPAPPPTASNPYYSRPANVAAPYPSQIGGGGGSGAGGNFYRGPATNLRRVGPGQAATGALPMGKVEAKFVILNEIQRLKHSLQALQSEKQQNQSQRLQESDHFTQLSLANQTLTHRMNEFNRSTVAMRELLRQKIGYDGMLELVESLQHMGVDPYPLLGTVPIPGSEGGDPRQQREIEQRIQRIARGDGRDEEGPFPRQMLSTASIPSTLLNTTLPHSEGGGGGAVGGRTGPIVGKPKLPATPYQRTLEEVFLDS